VLRKRRFQGRTKFAERCAEIGGPPLSLASLTNIESGRPGADGERRRDITVDELFVLAEALGVSPLSLLFPEDVGPAGMVEVLPGQTVTLSAAMNWFATGSHTTTRSVIGWSLGDPIGPRVAPMATTAETGETKKTAPVAAPMVTSPWSVGEHRVSFLGELDPGRDKRDPRSLIQPRTQAPLGGVSKFQIDASGTWFTAVDAETGQVSMIRILPETTLIVIDKS
jgi:hypothetical protein